MAPCPADNTYSFIGYDPWTGFQSAAIGNPFQWRGTRYYLISWKGWTVSFKKGLKDLEFMYDVWPFDCSESFATLTQMKKKNLQNIKKKFRKSSIYRTNVTTRSCATFSQKAEGWSRTCSQRRRRQGIYHHILIFWLFCLVQFSLCLGSA